MSEEYFGKWVFTPDGLVPGCIRAKDDVVEELLLEPPPSESRCALVLPAFVNAHSHIGDAFAYPAPRGTVDEVVGPGGFKHRALASASEEEKRSGMRRALELMQRTGTSVYVDFREEGIRGVSNLREASAGLRVKGVVLGRPSFSGSSEDEIAELLTRCDGLAFSAISDWPMEILEMASGLCAESGKLFALHASEARREDIDAILSLGPDFVVHMTAASESDISACADAEIPIVVCPRSNESFGLDPGIPRLMRQGVTVALGTDNAMLNEPNMICEIRAAFSLGARAGGISETQAVCLATYSGHKVLNPKGKITTELSTSDDLVVIDVQGEDPLLELVSPNGSADVYALICDRIVRRTRDWTA